MRMTSNDPTNDKFVPKLSNDEISPLAMLLTICCGITPKHVNIGSNIKWASSRRTDESCIIDVPNCGRGGDTGRFISIGCSVAVDFLVSLWCCFAIQAYKSSF